MIRALEKSELRRLEAAVPFVRQFGFVNYYDEQQFGSARHKQGFIAQKLIEGHHNGALKLYLTTPNGVDDSAAKRRKRELLANCGNWQTCLKIATFKTRTIFKY